MMIPAKLAKFIAKAGKVDEKSDKFANMQYWLEVLYKNTWKTVLLFWLAFVFGIWREFLGYFIVYCLLTVFYIIALASGEGIKGSVCLRSIIVYGTIAQVFSILPITYRIFKEGRPKDYVKGED